MRIDPERAVAALDHGQLSDERVLDASQGQHALGPTAGDGDRASIAALSVHVPAPLFGGARPHTLAGVARGADRPLRAPAPAAIETRQNKI